VSTTTTTTKAVLLNYCAQFRGLYHFLSLTFLRRGCRDDLVQVSRAENVFQIMYLVVVRAWCLSRLSRVIKNNIAAYGHYSPPDLPIPQSCREALCLRCACGTSLVHRLSMENLAQNVDDFFSEGYLSGGAHGLMLNAEQQVQWPDCATPSGALDPPRSQS
jgi:hypothetical protein